MMRFLMFLLWSAFFLSGWGQYDLSILEDSLTDGAKELIVYDSTSFYVKDINESQLYRKYKVIMLEDPLNEGKDLYLHQDQFKDVEFVNVTVKSIDGLVLEKLKLKDFNDVSTKGFSLASDSRLLYRNIIKNELPYIIEVDYQVSYSGSMFYPTWQPQDENVAVLSASFSVQSELPNSFRYESHNTEPDVIDVGKKVRWGVANLKPYKYEYYSYDNKLYGPVVYTAPNQFQMDLIEGDMSNWTSFGDWISKLNEGKDDLDTTVYNEVRSLVSSSASEVEKVALVYDYLQERTRYVSIQLGIGGWQPFSSNFVHSKGYGDCKALSFYAKSLLNKVGVDAYYTLINAGKYASETNKQFPISQFNHAILTVPLEEDTVWLECTSQTNPFGYLGTFTSDRNALLIKKGGSEIIRTKKYSLEENVMVSNYTIQLDEESIANVQLNRNYKGILIDEDRFDNITASDKNDQIDWFVDKNDWSSMEIESLEMKPPTNDVVPEAGLNATFKLRNVAKKAGKRLFIPLRSFLNSNDLIVDRSEKSYPFKIGYNKTFIDTMSFEIPVGYHLEANFKEIDFSCDFGSLKFNSSQEGNTITLTRHYTIKAGNHEANRYDEFQDFVSKVKKTERKQLVLVNKT